MKIVSCPAGSNLYQEEQSASPGDLNDRDPCGSFSSSLQQELIHPKIGAEITSVSKQDNHLVSDTSVTQ